MKTRIIITGANGRLGCNLVKYLIDNSDYDIIAAVSDSVKMKHIIENKGIEYTDRIAVISYDELFDKNRYCQNIDGVINFAFSRANSPYDRIASSLDFSSKIFRWIVSHEIPNSVYVSSQSIYGDIQEYRREDMVPKPDSVYAMAKYAGEKLFELAYSDKKELQHTILRLDYVIQSQNLVRKLCEAAISEGMLRLRGGKQVFSYLDERDVSSAIFALLNSKTKWREIYNVGHDRIRYSLMEIALMVKSIAADHGISGVNIELNESDIELWGGMETEAFMNDTGWKPKYDICKMVEMIFEKVCENEEI